MGITFKMIKRDDQNVFRVELRVFRFTHYKSAWEIFFHSCEFLEVNCEQRWSVFLLWENIVLTLIEVPVFLKIEWLMKMFCSLNILGWSIASYRHNISDMEQNFIVKERELIIWYNTIVFHNSESCAYICQWQSTIGSSCFQEKKKENKSLATQTKAEKSSTIISKRGAIWVRNSRQSQTVLFKDVLLYIKISQF